MSDQVQIEMVRGLAFGVPSIIAAIFSYLGLRQGKRNFTQMNGRMDQMLQMKGEASEAIGEKREKDREKP